MELQAGDLRQNRYPSEILEQDFQRMKASMEIESNYLDACKSLFYSQVSRARIFFDSMDDEDRDVSQYIFDEPAVKTTYKSI